MPDPDRPAAPAPPSEGRNALFLGLALALLTVFTFRPALENGFLKFDDDLYVTANPQVQQGLSGPGLSWALTAQVARNWHPLTIVSHMLDCQLFGLEPRGHHLTSLLLHLANVLLLFGVLRWMTGATARSAFAAALFAVHPLRVESVAWIAERKDVLSGLFWMLSLGAYLRWVRRAERHGVASYLLLALVFGLGLMAKPMVVTLPFVLLLLDLWPLARWRPGDGGQHLRPLILEKLPLLALSAAASAVALLTQKAARASEAAAPLAGRLANAVVSYVAYLGDFLWPRGLAAFYPMAPEIPVWQVAGAVLLLAGITVWVLRLVRTAPYLAVGWLWYLGTLVPVLGLIQVGSQARADRYTYLPSIGLALMVAWGVPDLVVRWRSHGGRTGEAQPWLAAAAVIVVLLYAVTARAQVALWHDDVTLFRHAARVTRGNYLAHLNLAEALRERGRRDEALAEYRAAVAARPGLAIPEAALGAALRSDGRPAEALGHLRAALRLDPNDARTHATLAMALDDLGRGDEAIPELRRALALDPGLDNARVGLAVLLARRATSSPRPRASLPDRSRGREPRDR